MVHKPIAEGLAQKQRLAMQGIQTDSINILIIGTSPLNGYKHPKATNSVFPQYKPPPVIDLRTENNPFAGFEHSGVVRRGDKIAKIPTTKGIEIEQVIESDDDGGEAMQIEKVIGSTRIAKKKGKSASRKSKSSRIAKF